MIGRPTLALIHNRKVTITMTNLTPNQVAALQNLEGGPRNIHARTFASLRDLGLVVRAADASGERAKVNAKLTAQGTATLTDL